MIFRNLEEDLKGVSIGGENLTNLRFADDIVLCAENKESLQTLLNAINDECKKVGLEINTEKTVIMTNQQKAIKLYVDSKEIEVVDQFKYLGQLVAFEQKAEIEIAARIASTWKRFWSLKYILLNNFPLYQKTKIMNSCILPILTYGSQTWALTDNQKRKLGINQRKMERLILKIKVKDKIKNSIIRRKTKIVDVLYASGNLKWKWAGHVSRYKDNRWTKVATDWIPRESKRKRGRQRTRWESDFSSQLGTTWKRRTEGKLEWEKLGNHFSKLSSTVTISESD